MEISNEVNTFAEKLVKSMIEKGIIKSEKDLDEEMVDRIINAIKEQVKNK